MSGEPLQTNHAWHNFARPHRIPCHASRQMSRRDTYIRRVVRRREPLLAGLSKDHGSVFYRPHNYLSGSLRISKAAPSDLSLELAHTPAPIGMERCKIPGVVLTNSDRLRIRSDSHMHTRRTLNIRNRQHRFGPDGNRQRYKLSALICLVSALIEPRTNLALVLSSSSLQTCVREGSQPPPPHQVGNCRS